MPTVQPYRRPRGRPPTKPTNRRLEAARIIQAAARRPTYHRHVKSVRSMVRRNRASIKRIKKSNLGGTFQRNFQLARMATGPGIPLFSKSQPFAFALNDFTSNIPANTSGGQIFTPSYIQVAPNVYDTSSVIIGNWYTANPAADNLTNLLSTKYHQWSDQNDQTVSPVQYMPLSANYNIHFTRATQDSAQPAVTIRVDVITTKRTYQKSQYHDYTMPDCLGAFQNMAISNEDGKKNAYNPALWSVRTRYVKMPAIDTGVNVVRQDSSRTLKLFERFKPKNIKLHLDPVSATQMEPFHLAVDPDIIRWCVISVGDNPATGANSGILIKLQRTIRYRDLDNKPL